MEKTEPTWHHQKKVGLIMGNMTCAHDIWHPHPHWVWTPEKLASFPTLSNKKNMHKNIQKKKHMNCLYHHPKMSNQNMSKVHNPYTTYIFFVKFLDSQKGAPQIIASSASRFPFTTRCRPARAAQLVVFRPVAELLQYGVKDHDIPRSHCMTLTQGFWPHPMKENEIPSLKLTKCPWK